MTGSFEQGASSAHDLYERAPCGLLTTESGGMIRRVNETLCQWLGYAREDLTGKKRLQDLLTIGCKIFHQTHWMPLLQIQNSVAEVQFELVHRDGQVLPMLVNALRRPEGSEVVHDLAFFLATDRRKYERELLLARRRAEEGLERERSALDALNAVSTRLRLALDSAQLLVWDVDLTTGAPTYDPGVRTLLRLPDEVVLNAEVYRACIHPDDRVAEQCAFARALEPGNDGTYAATYRLIGHDGVERVVSSSGRTIHDHAGRPAIISGVFQDVTNWRRAEEVLREREQEARRHAVLAEQLVGIVSHDLRTPLQAVMLGAGALRSSGLAPPQDRVLGRIVAAAQRANRLIADVLDLTQARMGGGLRVNRSQIDFHTLVAEGLEELKLAWPGRTVEHTRHGEGIGWADADRLSQVVTNLGGNALTYGALDQPITVGSTITADALTLTVHNHGPTIPEALLPHLFEPLRRGEQQVKLGSRSVGLGLYIVQQIALAHGGHITVRSLDAQGTTFTLSIPSAAPDGG